jgi:hypothetical protein
MSASKGTLISLIVPNKSSRDPYGKNVPLQTSKTCFFYKKGANLIANLVLTNIDGHEKGKSNMDLLHCSKLFSLVHNIGNLM